MRPLRSTSDRLILPSSEAISGIASSSETILPSSETTAGIADGHVPGHSIVGSAPAPPLIIIVRGDEARGEYCLSCPVGLEAAVGVLEAAVRPIPPVSPG